MKSGMSASPPVQKFSDLKEIWYVGLGRGRWVIHEGMLYDPIQGQGQGQGHGGLKCAEIADFKG